MRGPFKIRFWFALINFGVVGAICVTSAFFISDFLTRALIEREAEVSQEFLESTLPADREIVFTMGDDAHGKPINAATATFADFLTGLPGVIRANIYSADGMLVWSTEQRIVGRQFESNPELSRALKGARVTDVGWLPDPSKSEHFALGEKHPGRYIEAYIPIRSADGGGRVLGVVEFYKLPLALNATIKEGQTIIWFGALLAACILFVALYWIVERGATIIEIQQRDLAQMEAFAAIGQMASAVAHSLRNPMASIRSSAELWNAENPNNGQPAVKDIIQQIDRMDKHVRDLLNYSRSASYALRPVDPMRIINSNLPVVANSDGQARVVLTVSDSRRDNRAVLADEMLLGQALTSIFTNAIEAMTDGGALNVSVSDHGSDHIRIEVTDTGIGIAPDQILRVTESLFTTKSHGLGLGLTLAKRIVERFSGWLEVTSARGVGTTVAISLKAA